MTDMSNPPPLNNWTPESDKHILAVIGKLGEESAELSNICFRIIIQGLDGADPVTGKSNRQALMEELADVDAMIANTIHRLGLPANVITDRSNRKYDWKQPWFDFCRSLP